MQSILHGSALLLSVAPHFGSRAAVHPPSQETGSEPVQDVWTQVELEAVTAEIKQEVEELRGESFVRPVAVKVTDKQGFIGYANERMDEMGGLAKLAAEEAVMKMLGLVPPSMDLLKVTLDLLESQVGGFYDPSSETFFLMDSFTGGVAKVILAHELTHALDDQLYDIDGTLEERLDDRDASSAYMAVVEGSGTSVMSLWTMQHIRDLDPGDLKRAASMGTDSLAAAPAVLWKPLLASYTQGQSFLQKGYRLLKKQGKTMGDVTRMAFENPPRTTEQILHPEKYWDAEKRDDAHPLPEPAEAPEGWSLVERSTLGELHLALMTEEPKEIDFTNQMSLAFLSYSNDAAKGWGGDRLELYGLGDARSLILTTSWDTPQDAAEFVAALEQRLVAWRKALAELDTQEQGSGVEIEVGGEESAAVTIRCWYGVKVAPSGS